MLTLLLLPVSRLLATVRCCWVQARMHADELSSLQNGKHCAVRMQRLAGLLEQDCLLTHPLCIVLSQPLLPAAFSPRDD